VPSSVVFAALVLAWLVVLVPVVARRRQMVPRPAEADLSARVLPRTAGAPLIEEVTVATAQADGRARGERAEMKGAGGTALAERADETQEALDAELDLDADRDDLDELDGYDDGPVDEPTRATGGERVLRRPAHEERGEEPAGPEDLDDAYDAYDEDDAYDEYDDEDRWADEDDLDDREPAPARELRPYRPGRGGFDPDAAEAAAHARYAFRQRIALGLIAVAVLSALAALVVSSVMWWLHAAADVLLIGYLVFLRRQTRIEEEVRARRAARLSGERRALEARRERQAEHEARMASYGDTEWIDGEYDTHEDVLDDEDDEELDDRHDRDDAPRWAAPRTPPPPVPDDMELVDDTDDDPAFHDLDGERTYGYRRAAGA